MYLARWILITPALIASFIVTGIISLLFSEWIRLWYEPIVGFNCALVWVLVATLIAPDHKKEVAIVALTTGAICAWFVLESPSSYPEGYGSRSYQRTYLSYFVTIMGGVIGSVLCFWWLSRNKHDA